jgi:hypothetical protein
LTSALVADEWSASCAGRFTPEERALHNHWIGDRVGPRTSLDDVERRKILPLPGIELRPLGHPGKPGGLEMDGINQLFIYSGDINSLVTN